MRLRRRGQLAWAAAAILLTSSTQVYAEDRPPASEAAVPDAANEASADTAADDALQVDPEQVAQWIRDLDADQYAVREAAQKQLAAVGTPALESVAQVAAVGSLESATRAVNVLMEWADSRDNKLNLAALERVAALTTRPAESAIATERLATVREAAAIEAIKELGGRFDVDRAFGMLAGRSNALQVIIGPQWKGGVEGLKHIAAVRNATTLSLHSAPLGDDALPELLKLNQLGRMELYGTNISPDEVDKQLKAALPHVSFDVRSGARLGIRGLNIEEVVPDSPAEKAGLVPNDRITEFAGKTIEDFEQLTREIARCKPGDTVAIKVLRGGETIDKTVTFDRWGDDTRTKLNSPEMQQGALPLQLRRNGGRIIIQQGGQIIPVQPGQPIQIRPVPVPQQRR
jgi:hypothetical protein